MSELRRQIKKRLPFDSLEQHALLNLQHTADVLTRGFEKLFRMHRLSPTGYNVLRILRGEGAPLPCGEIAARMITRDPDMTRLLDRLEQRGLIERTRSRDDRRVVRASIKAAGLELLAQLDEPVAQLHARQLSHLGPQKLRTLIDLLDEARAGKGI